MTLRLRALVGHAARRMIGLLPPRLGVALLYRAHHGRWPDLDQPKRFTEKIQVRKLRDRDPRLPRLVDKVAIKAHVRDTLGTDWVIPTLWSGPALPPRTERRWPVSFVLKANNGSGDSIFVRDAGAVDWSAIERRVAGWHGRPHAAWAREWAYGAVPPALLVEPMIGDGRTLPVDYKIFVFGGRAHFVEVDTDRETAHKRTFFDRDWIRQSFTLAYPSDPRPIARPQHLDRLLAAAETLAADFPFVRVDLYDVDGRCLFGELTFYPDGGIGRFDPDTTDLAFGALWP